LFSFWTECNMTSLISISRGMSDVKHSSKQKTHNWVRTSAVQDIMLQLYSSGESFSLVPVKYEYLFYINSTPPYRNAMDIVNYYIQYFCLGKLKVGKLEIKYCFHQRYL
jgi:hypothetical protein